MEYFHLSIIKYYDKKIVAKFFRDTYHVSLTRAFQMANNLPFEDVNFFGKESSVNQLIGAAEFVCTKHIHDLPYGLCPSVLPTPSPEEIEYIEAIKWYNSLSRTKQRKIDLLTGRVKGKI